jgi:putative acetyltransferase
VKAYLKQHLVPANAIGIALYEKFGFEIEGTHRRYAFRNGQYVDAYSMARVRD